MIDDPVELDDDDDNIEHTYLTFQVGDEEFAVPVAIVTEIVRLPRSFAMPDVPSFIKGVVNLRGKVIPLLDVRGRFGLAELEYSERTVVVVIELEDTSTGLIVDAVSEVVEILPEQVDTRARFKSGGGSANMILGVGMRPSNVSFLLDVKTLIDLDNQGASVHGATSDKAVA